MIQHLAIVPILLFSVIIHEVAHGWMALRLGDPTARDFGRLTLNPIPHIDLFGSIIIPLLSLASAGRVFIAWAKPVPINPFNFSRMRRDDILVSVIGPLSNFAMALVCTLLFILLAMAGPSVSDASPVIKEGYEFLLDMFSGGITLNVILAIFNLLPVPPLDGSHVVASLLPASLSARYRGVGFFGIILILLLMRWAPFSHFFSMLIGFFMIPFESLVGLFLH